MGVERSDAPSLLQQVRAHAKARDSIAWSGQARQLLLWAADTIEAANAALSEKSEPVASRYKSVDAKGNFQAWIYSDDPARGEPLYVAPVSATPNTTKEPDNAVLLKMMDVWNNTFGSPLTRYAAMYKIAAKDALDERKD